MVFCQHFHLEMVVSDWDDGRGTFRVRDVVRPGAKP
jgi:hypothetical protein